MYTLVYRVFLWSCIYYLQYYMNDKNGNCSIKFQMLWQPGKLWCQTMLKILIFIFLKIIIYNIFHYRGILFLGFKYFKYFSIPPCISCWLRESYIDHLLVSISVATTLVWATIISCLDYHYNLLPGISVFPLVSHYSLFFQPQ